MTHAKNSTPAATMAAPRATQPHPASPCVGVCALDAATGHCIGCYRTAEEVGAWPSATVRDKLAILSRCETRRLAANAASQDPR